MLISILGITQGAERLISESAITPNFDSHYPYVTMVLYSSQSDCLVDYSLFPD
ncbi:MAG: hypothetical protein AAGF83_10365 [Cyanobacteria bacterium P01_G01_bin.67]